MTTSGNTDTKQSEKGKAIILPMGEFPTEGNDKKDM